MLKVRVITALVLLALVLSGLFLLPPVGWAVAAALFVAVAVWEWGGLLGFGMGGRYVLAAAFAVVCSTVAMLAPDATGSGPSAGLAAPWVFAVHGVATVFWVVLVPVWLRAGWPLRHRVGGLLAGAVVLFPAWLAVVQLRAAGPGVLLAVLAVVWMADVAAYFSGRVFGRHKLAPAISPGKTWEGAIGAGVGVVLYGITLRAGSGYAPISLHFWILGLLAVTAISILGDLFESMLKRQAGIKDSSNVLPGHGGVLDRIDSLNSTLPVVTLLWLLLLRSQG